MELIVAEFVSFFIVAGILVEHLRSKKTSYHLKKDAITSVALSYVFYLLTSIITQSSHTARP